MAPNVPTVQDVSNGGGRVWVPAEEVYGTSRHSRLNFSRNLKTTLKKLSLLKRSG